jgi:DNA (cytosine-5)-methyltransferase 1
MMKHLDLFSGIGGFSLGLQRTGGFETVAFCDFDKKTHAVLNKNFPGVPIFDDVRTLKGEDVGTIDIITGGFPCQDLSVAGKGAGLAGERSGLWYEMHRLIKETQPRWVIAENVAVLRSRGLEEVLRSLAEIGYDAEWHCIPASAVGAPHRRDRIWIVAYPNSNDRRTGSSTESSKRHSRMESGSSSAGLVERETQPPMAYTSCEGWEGRLHRWANPRRQGELGYLGRCSTVDGQSTEDWWTTEPNVGRVANGVSGRVDRLKQLGNALVPQIVTIIGSAILEAENDNFTRHT